MLLAGSDRRYPISFNRQMSFLSVPFPGHSSLHSGRQQDPAVLLQQTPQDVDVASNIIHLSMIMTKSIVLLTYAIGSWGHFFSLVIGENN